MKRSALARIDLAALQHNFGRVKQLAPDSRVMAVIKADAYGHGMVQAARALSLAPHYADAFAVAHLNEALALREAGIKQPLLVLQGFQNAQQLEQMHEHGIQPVVHQHKQLELLQQSSLQGVDIWLKINTGMGRLGFGLHEAADVYARLKGCNSVASITLMSHFANGDVMGHPLNKKQIQAFQALAEEFKIPTSLCNSAGLIHFPQLQGDWVRPGIMLYGSSPVQEQTSAQLGLKPVMSLNAPLIAINHLQAGDYVGYGSEWQCPQDMPLGIVGVGYGDGYPRHARQGTPVYINGQRSEIIGRVSMDMIAIDLSRVADACEGDMVELWGEHINIDEVARKAGTIAYELLCNLARCRA